MSSIGGYFELELGRTEEFHPKAIKLNAGRNALEYILLAKLYKKIYMPYFTCDVLLEPIRKLHINVEFYFIDEQFEPLFDFNMVKKNECFLYTNYFGLHTRNVTKLTSKCPNLIIDNAQSFYSKAIEGIDTFYSPRKFFGIPDGAYLYTNQKLNKTLEVDTSFERFEHLLRRIDESAEGGYSFFSKNDKLLNNNPIKQMSQLTNRLLCSIDYYDISQKRKENFNYLHQALSHHNKIKWQIEKEETPMVYPFYSEKENLRTTLINNKIYIAQYWTSVIELVKKNTIEYNYSVNLFHLPIDQRVTKLELDKIIKIIES
ncbi:MAG: hypothetical protein H7239_11680 [Flavobacterium sp.]|nr:hypothetical protein [Flavobacterium sp.]